MNGDGHVDIVGFGENGAFVALGNGDGTFAPAKAATTEFGASASAGGWSSNDVFPRELIDVNGDGRADIVAFGGNGVYVALGNSDGTFSPSFHDVNAFGFGSTAGSWSSESAYPRLVADINHDGFADIVGFGIDGTYVAYSGGHIFG